jgi:hypothetical protein
MSAEASQVAPAPVTKKKRGCLFWGLVLVVLVCGGSYAAYRYAIHRIVTGYTEPTALDLGEPALSPSQLGELDGRLAAFAQAVRNKHPVEPLVLSSEELTALVVRSPDFRRLGGRARLSIGDGEIESQLSVPLQRLGYPDRWFNGSARFAVTLDNGVLIVTLRSASVRGEPVADWIVEKLRQRNLAKDLYERPEVASLLARLESIEVRNGRITIVPRLR